MDDTLLLTNADKPQARGDDFSLANKKDHHCSGNTNCIDVANQEYTKWKKQKHKKSDLSSNQDFLCISLTEFVFEWKIELVFQLSTLA